MSWPASCPYPAKSGLKRAHARRLGNLACMSTISFARGIPAPECLPVEELADCARVAVERDGRTILSYGPSPGYEPLREWIADAARRRPVARLPDERLAAGVRVPRAAPRAGQARARRAADLRPAAEDPARARRRRRSCSPATTTGSTRTRSSRRYARPGDAAFLYLIPTFQNPSGRTLQPGAAPPDRRARSRSTTCSCWRTIPTGSCATRARRCRRSSSSRAATRRLQLVVLEDDRAGPASRLVRVPGGARARRSRRPPPRPTSRRCCSARRPCTSSSGAAASSRTSSASAGLLGARRDAMLEALDRDLPAVHARRGPAGGYFLWLELDGVDASRPAARAPRRPASPSSRGPTSAARPTRLRLAFSFVSPDEIGTASPASPPRCPSRPEVWRPGGGHRGCSRHAAERHEAGLARRLKRARRRAEGGTGTLRGHRAERVTAEVAVVAGRSVLSGHRGSLPGVFVGVGRRHATTGYRLRKGLA